MLEILLTSEAEQIFSSTLDDTLFDFRVIYNTRANAPNGLWVMDISIGETSLINGMALVSGVSLTQQYSVGPKNLYIMNVAGSNEDANSTNLGTDVRLFQLTDEEVASASSV